MLVQVVIWLIVLAAGSALLGPVLDRPDPFGAVVWVGLALLGLVVSARGDSRIIPVWRAALLLAAAHLLFLAMSGTPSREFVHNLGVEPDEAYEVRIRGVPIAFAGVALAILGFRRTRLAAAGLAIAFVARFVSVSLPLARIDELLIFGGADVIRDLQPFALAIVSLVGIYFVERASRARSLPKS